MTPVEIVAAHTVMWSIDGNIQCRCKALMRHDEHPEHVISELYRAGNDVVKVPEGMRLSLRYDRDLEIARLNAMEQLTRPAG